MWKGEGVGEEGKWKRGGGKKEAEAQVSSSEAPAGNLPGTHLAGFGPLLRTWPPRMGVFPGLEADSQHWRSSGTS